MKSFKSIIVRKWGVMNMVRDGVICPYKNKCTSYPHKCSVCRHNLGKRDFFEPIYDRYIPLPYWRKPYDPWKACESTKKVNSTMQV